ncbi:hypothetical protein [Terrihalobacillus insolitus]|uniref:hypothetical protein n=1 Tax=Terrihalobacillus insolitus TaxID=2950438 RepID=UPI00234256A5|nr:hypothetical protein [Terrihalobacillus insolitus]MDC3414040.1 hypothetical protein [Terrihalobacillus insolitus]
MNSTSDESEILHIVSSFEYSTKLELLLLKLEENGIPKKHIVAIPLDKKREQKKGLFDTIHHSDGVSVVDLGFILGMILMLLGVIYGYILPIGPIFLAFIGLLLGFGIGTFTKYLYLKRKKNQYNREQNRGNSYD